MDPIHSMISELEQEAAATRRLLEKVPSEKFDWKPHTKSMSLGQLALHVASIPGSVCDLLMLDTFDARNARFEPPLPSSKEELLSSLDDGLAKAKHVLSEWDQKIALSEWKLTHGERELFTLPKIGVARTILLNHWYHHRGQLTVYLRLLDIPLPVTYGRTADENPFA